MISLTGNKQMTGRHQNLGAQKTLVSKCGQKASKVESLPASHSHRIIQMALLLIDGI